MAQGPTTGSGRKAVFVFLAAAVSGACGGPPAKGRSVNAPSESAEERNRNERAPDVLEGESPPPSFEPFNAQPASRELGEIAVPGFLPAPVFFPENIDQLSDLRVFVFAHGAGGRGEHHCHFWEPQLPQDILLVCPQGSWLRRSDPEGGAYFPDHLALRNELLALVEALRQRFANRIQESGWRYVGYSQGATMGALAIVGEMSVFRELVLIEGGGENWTLSRALDFKKTGGERVLLACGTAGCARRAQASAAVLKQAGLFATDEYAMGVGHTYAEGVGKRVYEVMMAWEEEP